MFICFFFYFSLSRYALFKDFIEKIEKGDGSLDKFSKAYENYGIFIDDKNQVTCREWAPGAHEVYLTGDFSKLNNNK